MTHSTASPFLHVANGTATTNIIAAASIPGTLSIWADPLHEGPVPAGLTDSELLEVRERFLAGSTENVAVDPVNDLRQWRAAIERHQSYDELILWFEHDLFDQLNLIQVLTWIHERVPASKPVTLVCIGSFPGHPGFKGLGQLAPDELASLLETRERVSDRQYQLAERAWQAFREPTPDALNDLRQSDTAALPFLHAALERFLQEYPWTTDGLSRTERRLLELAGSGTVDLAGAFPRMHVGESAFYLTDTGLVELAESLSGTSPPLLTLSRDYTMNGSPLRGAVTITDIGRSVLTGERDKIATCGIDRWLGGVHLQSDADTWRWDDTSKTITSMSCN